MKICYIIGAAKAPNLYINRKNAFVITADGGYNNVGFLPDLAVGDFDSLGFVPNDTKTEVLPVEKDETDMAYAVNAGLKKGFDTFVIYGGTGGRPDHTFANISLLAKLAKVGKKAYLIGDGYVTTAITNDAICFKNKTEGTVSVFSAESISLGVSEKGLKYSLDNYDLAFSDAIGVSNSFIGKDAEISVKDGTLIVMWEEENIKKFIDNL